MVHLIGLVSLYSKKTLYLLYMTHGYISHFTITTLGNKCADKLRVTWQMEVGVKHLREGLDCYL